MKRRQQAQASYIPTTSSGIFQESTSRQDSKDTLRQEPSYSNPDSGFRESSRSTSRHDDSPRHISLPSRRWYDEYDGPPLSSNLAVTMMKGKDTVGAQKEIGMSDDLLEEIAMTVISCRFSCCNTLSRCLFVLLIAKNPAGGVI